METLAPVLIMVSPLAKALIVTLSPLLRIESP